MMIGLLHEAGIDFHLSTKHWLHLWIDSVPCWYFGMAFREFAILWDNAKRLLTFECFFAESIPTAIELAFVLVSPLFGHMMWSVCRARRIVDEERPVGSQCLLLTHPVDGAIGQIFVKRVSLLRRFLRLDSRRPFKEVRIILMSFSADEAIEVLETSTAGGPVIEGADRAALPDGNFMAFAELRGGIPIEFQRLSQRRAGVRLHGVLSRGGGCKFRDRAHSNRVMVSPTEQGGTTWRAQRRRVEARVLQPFRRKLLEIA